MDGDLPDLKDCPFCGGPGWLITMPPEEWPQDRTLYQPRCKKCGGDLGGFPTKAEAIAAWNTRAPDAALTAVQAEIASLRELLAVAEGALEVVQRQSKNKDMPHAVFRVEAGICAAKVLTAIRDLLAKGDTDA